MSLSKKSNSDVWFIFLLSEIELIISLYSIFLCHSLAGDESLHLSMHECGYVVNLEDKYQDNYKA